MRIHIKENGKRKAVMFFSSCGMDWHAVDHLCDGGEYDVLILYDYSRIKMHSCREGKCINSKCFNDCPVYRVLNVYSEIFLIAWGSGVWAATYTLDRYTSNLCSSLGDFYRIKFLSKIRRAISINGAVIFISELWGVSPAQLDRKTATLPDGFSRYTEYMCGSRENLEFYRQHPSGMDGVQMKEELINIRSAMAFSNTIAWDTAVIFSHDSIIPTEKQRNFWNNYSLAVGGKVMRMKKALPFRIIERQGHHYPFAYFRSWQEIIDL